MMIFFTPLSGMILSEVVTVRRAGGSRSAAERSGKPFLPAQSALPLKRAVIAAAAAKSRAKAEKIIAQPKFRGSNYPMNTCK